MLTLLGVGGGGSSPPPPPFSPTSIAGLVLWLKADAGVYKDAGVTPAANGDTVQQWNDFSGNGNNQSQATSGNRPAFTTSGINSAQSVVFNIASQTTLSGAANMGGTTQFAAFAVATLTAVGSGDGRVVTFIATGDGVDYASTTSNLLLASQQPNRQSANTSNFSTINTDDSGSAAKAYSVVYDGTNRTLYRNNVSAVSSTLAPTLGTTGSIYLGSRGGADFYQGSIAEVCVYNGPVTSTDRANLQTYFNSRWGV